MNTLTFFNETVLDPEAFKVMGLSVKAEGSFGMFGTGLKYAIATILRSGDSVEIVSNGNSFHFDYETRDFRGESFGFVRCNGEDVGFTTQLGKCWEPWMAYRELLCNATDEGGGVMNVEMDGPMTRVIVRGDVLSEVHKCRRKWFLDTSRTPVWENESVQLFHGRGRNYFYQGIYVGSFGNECPYTVNFKNGIHLSEDRLDKYPNIAALHLSQRLCSCDNKDVLKNLINNEDFPLNFSNNEEEPSEEFLELVSKAYKRDGVFVKGTKEMLLSRQPDLVSSMEQSFTDRENKMLGKVCDFLEGAGFNVGKFPIVKFATEGKSLLGHARGFDKISLTPAAFEMGTFELAMTVLEEFAHCESRTFDFTREFQDFLFRSIISQAEKNTGDIL